MGLLPLNVVVAGFIGYRHIEALMFPIATGLVWHNHYMQFQTILAIDAPECPPTRTVTGHSSPLLTREQGNLASSNMWPVDACPLTL